MKHIHYNKALHFKYFKFKNRLDNAIKSGVFRRYTHRKRQMLLKRLERLQRQIEQLGTSKKLVLGSMLTVSALTFNKPEAYAQATGDEFIVNIQTANSQNTPAIAMDDDGDFVITWESDDQDGDGTGIYAQRYDATGLALGREFLVNTYTTGDQESPSIAMDSDGDFVVAWQSEDQDGDGNGVYAQRFSALGVAEGEEFLVNTYITGDQESPSVAIDGAGDFVVAWQSEDQDGDGDGVYAQRFSSLGDFEGEEFSVKFAPVGAMDSDGDFVIVWQSNGQDGDGNGIYGQRYNVAGEAEGGEFSVNIYTTSDQNSPSIAMDDDGDFVVAWKSGFQDEGNDGIYAKRYDSSGNALEEDEIHVNTFQVNASFSEYQNSPSVAMDSDGDFVIAWESDYQDGGAVGVYGQRFDNLGEAVDGEFLINTYTTSSQSKPATAMDSLSDFVITWQSNAQDGSSSGIYAQRYEVDTAPIVSTIEDQAITEGEILEFEVIVSNDEGQTITYSLDETSVAEGMEIDEEGIFSWVPSNAQASDHIVIVTVSDGLLEDNQTFTITVNDIPVLGTIGDQSAVALSELSFTVETVDLVGELVYSLDASSLIKGMEIDEEDGSFNWTPTDLQIGEHVVTVYVSDGILEASEVFTITVNDTPILESIGDQSAVALSELTFTASTAIDFLGDDLIYSLDTSSEDKGMIIDSSTGEFSWTPTDLQIGDHTVTVTVSDGTLDDSETFTISVNDILVLVSIRDKSIAALSELSFTAETAGSVSGLTYSLDASSLVKDMEIDEEDGSFSWTPTDLQIGEHVVTVFVTDGSFEASEVFTITVNDTPMLDPIGDQSAVALSELTFTADAASDIVGDDLTYGLDASSKDKGMIIDSSTGEFSWTPEEAQVGNHTVTITVSDDDLEGSETFEIVVAPAPVILSVSDEIVGIDINVYPNPVQSVLYLKSNQENKLTGFSIMNLSGKLMESGGFRNESPEIYVEALPVGIYILEIYGEAMTHQLRFVKEL